MEKNAVILLSGGIDSTTTLAIAKHMGFKIYALTFDYGQRHSAEIEAAKDLRRLGNCDAIKVFKIDLTQIGGSALTDDSLDLPYNRTSEEIQADIPITYVPARNSIFLSIALAYAEITQSHDIFIGANAIDYSGYPDCRPEYIDAFRKVAAIATKSSLQNGIRIHAPLVHMSKADIIKTGDQLGVDYALTISCYDAIDKNHCGKCDSCKIRYQGFLDAGVSDPTIYRRYNKKI